MKILGIETSCDDTGIAIINATGEKNIHLNILAHEIASQVHVHQKYGGVYPSLAKREHQKNLPIVLEKVLQDAHLPARKTKARTVPALDAIALTVGPGLSPCLWTGINFAKEIATEWSVPIIPVDHIEAHLLVGLFLERNGRIPDLKETLPAIGLIVSGGHSQLVLVEKLGKYKIIGETRDDAAGECFDKTARVLGLAYPGGPEIAAAAARLSSKSTIKNLKFAIKLPRPMMHTKDYDFSFSGLKTAVLYDYQSRSEKERKSKQYIQEMAHEIQQAICDVLVSKTIKATKEYKVKSVILGGGVAANEELRKQLKEAIDNEQLPVSLLIPAGSLSTDNGVMIAIAGYIKWLEKKYTRDMDSLEAQPNLRIA